MSFVCMSCSVGCDSAVALNYPEPTTTCGARAEDFSEFPTDVTILQEWRMIKETSLHSAFCFGLSEICSALAKNVLHLKISASSRKAF